MAKVTITIEDRDEDNWSIKVLPPASDLAHRIATDPDRLSGAEVMAIALINHSLKLKKELKQNQIISLTDSLKS